MAVLQVGILGATGTVGQRFIQLLESSPTFKIAAIGASDRSAGQVYTQACNWKLDTPIPPSIAGMTVSTCIPSGDFLYCDLVFSGLDSSVATEIESAFRDTGIPVFSNAKNYRMHKQVPLVVPFVNPDHLDMVKYQRKSLSNSNGFIVTNANCSTTGLVVALKPIHDKYGIQSANITTMQAISGAGYPGVSSLDILGNIVPYIGSEEDKIEAEPLKILGSIDHGSEAFVDSSFTIDATCNRVPVVDGHIECVSLKLVKKPESLDEVVSVLESFPLPEEVKELKHHVAASIRAIEVMKANDRPQPRLDLMRGFGFSVSIGRLRSGNQWDLQFTMLSHNTILGAAGSAILNAEIALRKGLLSSKK